MNIIISISNDKLKEICRVPVNTRLSLINHIQQQFEFLISHNKNYTQKQYYSIIELNDIFNSIELMPDVFIDDDPMSNEAAAEIFVTSIKSLAEKPNNINNFKSYLSQHFDEWLEKWANNPENIAAEIKSFADMIL